MESLQTFFHKLQEVKLTVIVFCSLLSHVEVLDYVSYGTVTTLLNACVCKYN